MLSLLLFAGPALAGDGDPPDAEAREAAEAEMRATAEARAEARAAAAEARERARAAMLEARAEARLAGAPRGYLGVETQRLTPDLRRHFGAADDAGVLLARVLPDSPAAAAGLAVGDVVTAVDGEPVHSTWALTHMIGAHAGGSEVEITYVRDATAYTTVAVLEERERQVIDLSGALAGLEGLQALEALEGLEHLPPIAYAEVARAMAEIDMAGVEESLRAHEEIIEEALRSAHEALAEDEELREHMRRYREVEAAELEEKMRQLEEKMRELERELEENGPS